MPPQSTLSLLEKVFSFCKPTVLALPDKFKSPSHSLVTERLGRLDEITLLTTLIGFIDNSCFNGLLLIHVFIICNLIYTRCAICYPI
jgi:hypothetical protein